MEILPNIHRLEVPLGDRYVCVYLLTGSDGTLVLDTGLDDTPASIILPYLESIGVTAQDIRYVVNSHIDVDHTGGNLSLRELAPQALFMCHELDRRMVEDLELMISVRYGEFAADHDIADSEDTLSWIRSSARHAPVDIGLSGGETIRLGSDWQIEVLFTPGHSRGHITLYDAGRKTALISDAVLWNSILTAGGEPAFPPTYRYVDSYIASMQRVQSLTVDHLLTSHYPVYHGAEATAFLRESEAYVQHVDRALADYLQNAAGAATLRQIITELHPNLGSWPEGAELLLDFPLLGHLERLVQYGHVAAERQGELLAYTWVG